MGIGTEKKVFVEIRRAVPCKEEKYQGVGGRERTEKGSNGQWYGRQYDENVF